MEITAKKQAILYLGLTILLGLSGHSKAIDGCLQKSACSCLSEKGLIDLSPLSTSKVPPTLHTTDDDGVSYYFNPCKDFTYGGQKGGIISRDPSNVYASLGSNVGTKFSTLGGKLELSLAAVGGKKSNIEIKCGQALTFVYQSTFQTLSTFQLISQEGCPGYTPPKSEGGGLSAGSIMLIVFFVLVFCYFVFGTVFQVFVRKAEGAERIPNVALWAAIPSLVLGGFKFTLSCGRR